MTMKRIFAGLFLTMMTLTSQVYAQVKMTDEKGQVVAWPAKEEFFTNADGYRQYGVTVEIPDAASGTEIITENGTSAALAGKTIWYIQSGFDSLTYKTKSGLEKKISANWTPQTKTAIVVERCQNSSARVQLKDPKKPLNFPLAVSCDNSQKTLNITLSVPAQVEWMDSTLFEVAGKGEPWRSYSLPATSPKGGAIGTIHLKNGDQEYVLELITPKNIDLIKKEAQQKAAQKNANELQQAIYLGKLDLSYTAAPVTSEDSKYSFKYTVLSPKYMNFFKIGGEFRTSFALSKKTEAVDMLYYNAHIGYHYNYKNVLDLGLRAIFSGLTVQQKSSTAKLTSNQAGYGIFADYLIDPKNRLIGKVNMIGMMSEVVKSHTEIGVEYRYLFNIDKKQIWLGAAYNSETYTAETAAGLSREFKNTELQLVVGF
ncbi:hypothetical protein CIK05_13635 [Bdellovibrio sp. qaytius]|nr:hypothetical protein CIK05_13635 [Bdellovibrio sp. qaytius]